MNLGRNEIHLWAREMGESPGDAQFLSAEEKCKAAAFVFPRDRHRYLFAHTLLREVLASLLRCPPGELPLLTDAGGKPRLRGDPLFFNLSHSGPYALIGATLHGELGVDIEAVRPMPEALALARQMFAPSEAQALAALPTEEARTQAFFRCWTRKEAYLKACGRGLALEPNRFAVSCAADRAPQLLAVFDDPAEVTRWQLIDLAVGEGVIAAAAIRDCPLTKLRLVVHSTIGNNEL